MIDQCVVTWLELGDFQVARENLHLVGMILDDDIGALLEERKASYGALDGCDADVLARLLVSSDRSNDSKCFPGGCMDRLGPIEPIAMDRKFATGHFRTADPKSLDSRESPQFDFALGIGGQADRALLVQTE